MSQKREKDETELKVPETIPICMPLPPITAPPSNAPLARLPETSDPEATGVGRERTTSDSSPEEPDLAPKRGATKRPREGSRCPGSGCRKRIGLIGFRCRCGDVFCSEHRYSDRHDCSYDYKAAGRESISRENPVVKAAKLLKV